MIGDSMIYTGTRGPVPISEVVPGDAVLSWDNGHLVPRAVIAAVPHKVRPLYRVRTRGFTFRARENHLVLVIRRMGRKSVNVPWQASWSRLNELCRGDVLVSLDRHQSHGSDSALPDGTPLDEDAAWFIGQVVGDGNVTNSGVCICALENDSEDRERLQAFVKSRWQANSALHTTHGVIVHSAAVRNVLRALCLDRKSFEKLVPSCILRSGAQIRRAFLAGYAAADGHLDKRGHTCYGSSSHRLTAEVRAMHVMLGDRVSNITITRRTKPIVIRGRTVRDAKPLYSFTVYPNSRRRHQTLLDVYGMRRALPDSAFGVERVLAVEPDGEEETFEIQVDGSHGYVAEGVVARGSLLNWKDDTIEAAPGGCGPYPARKTWTHAARLLP